MDVLEDVRLGGVGDDVWGRVFGDALVFAGQLYQSLATSMIAKEDSIPACWPLDSP